jgi:hypothetical protein
MATTVRRLRLVGNPRKHRQHARKRNNVLYVLTNPKRKAMAKRSRSRNKSHRRHHFGLARRTKSRNPFRRRRHSRNPLFGGVSMQNIVELGVGAAGGVIGAGYLSQMVLGSNNVGVTGYFGDAIATLAIAWAAQKFLGRGELAKGVLAGGFGAIIKRFWDDNVSGTSTSMSGLGNRSFAGLGYYTSRNFPLPTSTYQPGMAVPSLPVTAGAAPQVVIPSQPVSPAAGSSKRFTHRFN